MNEIYICLLDVMCVGCCKYETLTKSYPVGQEGTLPDIPKKGKEKTCGTGKGKEKLTGGDKKKVAKGRAARQKSGLSSSSSDEEEGEILISASSSSSASSSDESEAEKKAGKRRRKALAAREKKRAKRVESFWDGIKATDDVLFYAKMKRMELIDKCSEEVPKWRTRENLEKDMESLCESTEKDGSEAAHYVVRKMREAMATLKRVLPVSSVACFQKMVLDEILLRAGTSGRQQRRLEQMRRRAEKWNKTLGMTTSGTVVKGQGATFQPRGMAATIPRGGGAGGSAGCFTCGSVEHRNAQCPSRARGFGGPPPSMYSYPYFGGGGGMSLGQADMGGRHGGNVRGGFGGGRGGGGRGARTSGCFHCGEEGHYARDCMKAGGKAQ